MTEQKIDNPNWHHDVVWETAKLTDGDAEISLGRGEDGDWYVVTNRDANPVDYAHVSTAVVGDKFVHQMRLSPEAFNALCRLVRDVPVHGLNAIGQDTRKTGCYPLTAIQHIVAP